MNKGKRMLNKTRTRRGRRGEEGTELFQGVPSAEAFLVETDGGNWVISVDKPQGDGFDILVAKAADMRELVQPSPCDGVWRSLPRKGSYWPTTAFQMGSLIPDCQPLPEEWAECPPFGELRLGLTFLVPLIDPVGNISLWIPGTLPLVPTDAPVIGDGVWVSSITEFVRASRRRWVRMGTDARGNPAALPVDPRDYSAPAWPDASPHEILLRVFEGRRIYSHKPADGMEDAREFASAPLHPPT